MVFRRQSALNAPLIGEKFKEFIYRCVQRSLSIISVSHPATFKSIIQSFVHSSNTSLRPANSSTQTNISFPSLPLCFSLSRSLLFPSPIKSAKTRIATPFSSHPSTLPRNSSTASKCHCSIIILSPRTSCTFLPSNLLTTLVEFLFFLSIFSEPGFQLCSMRSKSSQ